MNKTQKKNYRAFSIDVILHTNTIKSMELISTVNLMIILFCAMQAIPSIFRLINFDKCI